jgi:hypothetical protein
MNNERRGIGLVHAIWMLAGILLIVAVAWHIVIQGRTLSVEFPTPYQAVLLTNGAVFFGHLQGFGTPHPVLTEVYYVVSQTNSETKQVNSALVKRGKELHEPDRMYLNPSQIVLVEPVGVGSKVAQLIAQAK